MFFSVARKNYSFVLGTAKVRLARSVLLGFVAVWQTKSLLLTAASKESDESRSTHDNFHRKVIDQFYCKLLLSSDIVKAEAIVVEPFKRKTSEFIFINKTFNRERPL